MDDVKQEIAAAAAALVVDEGLDYGAAKQRALRGLGLPARTPLPDNLLVETAVREHIAIFHADTQPGELRALRQLALQWMERFADYQPLIGGALWHGTATALNDIYLQLFADDPKDIEIALINQNLDYDATTVTGLHGQAVEALTLVTHSEPLQSRVLVHLLVNDTLAQRGALQPDEAGRKPRGDARALRNLLLESESSLP